MKYRGILNFLICTILFSGQALLASETRDFQALDSIEIERLVSQVSTDGNRDENARYLYLNSDWNIAGQGACVYHQEVLLLIAAEKAKHEYGDLKIQFNAEFETVEVLTAETITGDGARLPIMEGADNEMVPPELAGTSVFGDHRIRVVSFSGVETGAILHWVIQKTIQYPPEDGFIADSFLLQQFLPVDQLKVRLHYPDDAMIYLGLHNACPGPDKSHSNSMEWSLNNIPAVPDEWNMPPIRSHVPWCSFSTMSDDQTGEWLRQRFYNNWRHIEPLQNRIMASKELNYLIEKSDESSFEKILERCHRYVVDEISLISVIPAQRNFKPSSPVDTVNRRFGDLIDKAVLLVHLLKLNNVSSDIFLHTMFPAESTQEIMAPADMSGVAVVAYDSRGRDVWLNIWDRNGKTGWFDPGPHVAGVRLTSSDTEKVIISSPLASRSISQRKIDMVLHTDGTAEGVMEFTGTGLFERRFRAALRDESEHELSMFWDQRLAEAEIPVKRTFLKNSDWSDFSGPVSVQMGFKSPWAGAVTGDMMIVMVPDFPVAESYRRMYMLSNDRQTDVLMGTPCLEELDVSITVPEEYEIAFYPVDRRWSVDGLTVIQKTEYQGNKIMLRRRIHWKESIVGPEQYKKLYETWAAFTSEGENLLILQQRVLDK